MSKSNAYETSILALLFNTTAIADLAENDTSSPFTALWLSLHEGDPGEAGNQATNEATYASYARFGASRSTSDFTVAGNSVTLASNVDFPACTADCNTANYFGLGTASSGAGILMYSGSIAPTIAITSGVTPRLTTATAFTED